MDLFICLRLDPKDLDVLLAEITLLNTRAELYLRFVRRRISVSDLITWKIIINYIFCSIFQFLHGLSISYCFNVIRTQKFFPYIHVGSRNIHLF